MSLLCSLVTVQVKAPFHKTNMDIPHFRVCTCTCAWAGRCRYSDCIGVVGSECMQIAQLTKATLDVCHMDLNVILEATGNAEK